MGEGRPRSLLFQVPLPSVRRAYDGYAASVTEGSLERFIVSVAGTEHSGMSTDDRDRSKKRRRFTGNAYKSKGPVVSVKEEPNDSLELAVHPEVIQCDSKAATLQIHEIEVGAALCPAEEISRSSCSPASMDPIREAEIAFIRTYGIADFVLLYFTLVSDDVLPRGYLVDFAKLEAPARRASERKLKLVTNISDAEAEMRFKFSQEQKLQESPASSSAADQIVVAANLRPKRFRTK